MSPRKRDNSVTYMFQLANMARFVSRPAPVQKHAGHATLGAETREITAKTLLNIPTLDYDKEK